MSWGWREYVVFVGSLAWWGSLAGHLTWNVIGAMTVIGASGGLDRDDSMTLWSCLTQCLQYGEADFACVGVADHVAKTSLFLGVASFWWNNRLMAKVQGSGGRMVGLTEYYKLQVVAISARLAAWWILHEDGSFDINPSALRGSHAIMLGLLILVSLQSLSY